MPNVTCRRCSKILEVGWTQKEMCNQVQDPIKRVRMVDLDGYNCWPRTWGVQYSQFSRATIVLAPPNLNLKEYEESCESPHLWCVDSPVSPVRHRCRASVDPLSRISNPRATAINHLYWATPVRSEDPHMRCQHPWDRNGPGPGFTPTSSVEVRRFSHRKPEWEILRSHSLIYPPRNRYRRLEK